MSMSILLLLGVPLYLALREAYTYEAGGPETTTALLLYIFVGLPLCVCCWWAALEVADDRHWERGITESCGWKDDESGVSLRFLSWNSFNSKEYATWSNVRLVTSLCQ
jgi:hypothetical protein